MCIYMHVHGMIHIPNFNFDVIFSKNCSLMLCYICNCSRQRINYHNFLIYFLNKGLRLLNEISIVKD